MFSRIDRNAVGTWFDLKLVPVASYTCGYCGNLVSSKDGYYSNQGSNSNVSVIRICPNCGLPTVFCPGLGGRSPMERPGGLVEHVPEDLGRLYEEARTSTGSSAFTGAVLLCRKILMHVAVAEGADSNKSFLEYVRYLADKGFVPPHRARWVDYIRTRGNEANHEIELMTEEEATALVKFVEMLLKFIYEFPNQVPDTVTTSDS